MECTWGVHTAVDVVGELAIIDVLYKSFTCWLGACPMAPSPPLSSPFESWRSDVAVGCAPGPGEAWGSGDAVVDAVGGAAGIGGALDDLVLPPLLPVVLPLLPLPLAPGSWLCTSRVQELEVGGSLSERFDVVNESFTFWKGGALGLPPFPTPSAGPTMSSGEAWRSGGAGGGAAGIGAGVPWSKAAPVGVECT